MPLGVTKCVSCKPRLATRSFIQPTYVSREPASDTATCSAASLPLGSIIPYSSVSSLRCWFGSMPMTDEPSHATSAPALTVVVYTRLISDSCSRATMVFTILVIDAGAARPKPSCSYNSAPEPSSTIATWAAVTLGGGSAPSRRGPPVAGSGAVGALGGEMRIIGAFTGMGRWLGGDAVSQYCCCMTSVAVSVAANVGVAVGGAGVGVGGTAVGDAGIAVAVAGATVGGAAVGTAGTGMTEGAMGASSAALGSGGVAPAWQPATSSNAPRSVSQRSMKFDCALWLRLLR